MSKALKSAAYRLQVEIRICRLVLRDSRAPRPAKLLLWLALAHALSPIDLVPDFVPLLGQLDDLIIVPALLIAALKLIPKEVIEDCRAEAIVADQIARSESSTDNFWEESREEREETGKDKHMGPTLLPAPGASSGFVRSSHGCSHERHCQGTGMAGACERRDDADQ